MTTTMEDRYYAEDMRAPDPAPATPEKEGTNPMTYEEALAEVNRRGPVHASDPARMAGLCDAALQHVVGAASPQLVWEGAQKQGLTTMQLMKLCRTDPSAVHDLMWL